MTHLNLMASGTTGVSAGPPGSTELRRALELPMTWTLDLLARPEYAGGVKAPAAPVAYFEALPTAPAAGTAVTFNGGGTATHGTPGAAYTWSFGDGTFGHGAVARHAYAQDGWYTAKLVVRDRAGRLSGYEEDIQVGSPSGAEPATDPCGALSRNQAARVLAGAR
jgi:PKD repeat protein